MQRHEQIALVIVAYTASLLKICVYIGTEHYIGFTSHNYLYALLLEIILYSKTDTERIILFFSDNLIGLFIKQAGTVIFSAVTGVDTYLELPAAEFILIFRG